MSGKHAEPEAARPTAVDRDDEQLRIALEAAQLLSWDWNLETGAIRWAGTIPGFLQLPRSIPRPSDAPLPLVWPADRERVRQAALRALDTNETTTVEFRLMAPGRIRWISATGRAYRNAQGEAVRIVGVLRDVTAHKEAEADLQTILDAVPAFIWYKDRDNRILRANRRALDSMTAPLGGDGASTYDVYPEEAAKYHGDDLEVINTGLPKLGIIEPLTMPSGDKLWVRTDKVPYRNAAGEIVGVIVFAVDISERILAENELRRAQADLERRVEVRTRDLQEAVQALRAEIVERERAETRMQQHQAELAHLLRLHTVEGMAAQLAHELNQPLSAIINFASGLTRRLGSGTTPSDALQQVSQDIGREAMRAAAVVQRLREFVRKGPPRREPCELSDIICNAMLLIDPDMKRQGIASHVDVCGGATVIADRIQIEQVVLNLLRNALQAIEAVPTGPREITLETVASGEQIEVRVGDTGIGLPSDGAAELFEPFFTTKKHGLGMGLSISRSILEAHGGSLSAQPNPPRGATFVFTLPLRR